MDTVKEALGIDGLDVAIEKLRPLNERAINFGKHPGFRKIVASMRTLGLIEPLSVFLEGSDYVILDGYLRYIACKELGMTTVPCLVHKDKQAYSFNRNVNRLSGSQEVRMLKKSMETIDEATIAATFGLKTISARIEPAMAKQLHPEIVKAFNEDVLSRSTIREMPDVCPPRQVEILAEMKRTHDFSPAFCRALVINSVPAERMRGSRQRKAWGEDSDRRKSLMDRLDQAEKKHEFYSNLYRQYTTDLIKVTFYVRKLLMTERIEKHLQVHHSEVYARFRAVVLESSSAEGP